MSTHTGTFPVYQDANGEVGVKVVYPYTVDVRGEGHEPTIQRVAVVAITWYARDADGDEYEATLVGLDREALEMLAAATRAGSAYLDRVQPVDTERGE